MLWYRTWLETRSRFLICLGGLVALFALNLLSQTDPGLALRPDDYYARRVHMSFFFLVFLWTLCVNLLMMGGLLRETSAGTSSFTLALPVTRTSLMRARVGLTLAQAAALGIVPGLAIFAVAASTGPAPSLHQTAYHLGLLLSGGSVIYALALLSSCLIRNEYTAAAVSAGLTLLLPMTPLLNSDQVQPLNYLYFMHGQDYFDLASSLFTAPFPWLHCLANPVAAALLIAVSVKAVTARDF